MQVHTMSAPTEAKGRWEIILWGDEFLTGHTGMDADHQRLLSIFNEFSLAVNAGKGDLIIRNILDELLDYTQYHFEREEMIMQENHFPDYARHKKMHDTFIRQIEDVSIHLSVGSDMSAFLLSFLAKWLSGHIMGADHKLGQFLEHRGIAEH
ncbi:MAG: bacteriohemerythrin [Rhodospirillaceae bacterium]